MRIVPFLLVATLGCSKPVPRQRSDDARALPLPPRVDATAADDASDSHAESLDASRETGITSSPPEDAAVQAPLHKRTAAELIGLITNDAPPLVLRQLVAPVLGRLNQGNPDIAEHAVSRAKCLEGLRGVVIQTPEQRAACGGAVNMVPVYKGGDPARASYCIDVFEFPNVACELPFVWASPSQAELVCKSLGKRLCTQDEWNLACRGDPAGGADRVYAYGSDLDLSVCHTNKPHGVGPDGRNWRCLVKTAQTAWDTCGTDTEPAGAFPACRSRFGVFDQHGNVAEIMSRAEAGTVYTQLKGSAFFYVDVARKHNEPHPKGAPRDTYPDHCNYDPRWHVERLERAMHVNYHLGFRCCRSVPAVQTKPDKPAE